MGTNDSNIIYRLRLKAYCEAWPATRLQVSPANNNRIISSTQAILHLIQRRKDEMIYGSPITGQAQRQVEGFLFSGKGAMVNMPAMNSESCSPDC